MLMTPRMAYWLGGLYLILAALDHVVAEETEGEVVVRSDDAGEGGDDGDRVEEILKDLSALHLNYEEELFIITLN